MRAYKRIFFIAILLCAVGAPEAAVWSADCNGNGSDDVLDISSGVSEDCNANGVPDECELGECGKVEFRRGDVNIDGIVDISDSVAACLFAYTGRFCSCMDAADVNDDGRGDSGGQLDSGIQLLEYLFAGRPIPAPGPETPGPDPTEVNDENSCDAYDPVPPPKLADVSLGFEGCPAEIKGKPGEVKTLDLFATLTTRANQGLRGAQALSAGFGVEGGTVKDVSRVDMAWWNQRWVRGARHSVDGRPGRVVAYLSPIIRGDLEETAPKEGTFRIAAITLEVTIPDSDQPVPVTLRFEDGFGQPAIRNVVTIDGASQIPTLGSCTVLVKPLKGTPFHRGDPNGSGAIDIADAIYMLSYLFASGPEPTCMESADTDNSGQINIADPISLLGYLFSQDPPPAEPGPPTEPCGTDPDPKGSPGDLGCELYERC